MLNLKTSLSRAAFFALLLGTLALTHNAHAAPIDPTARSGPPTSTITYDSNGNVTSRTQDTSMSGRPEMYQDTSTSAQTDVKSHKTHHSEWSESKHHWTPEDMKAHVEQRIAKLHSKLMITPEQEPEWQKVADAMRASETNVSSLIHSRHENSEKMTAVDDMESYQQITQAHADGLKNVNSSFKELYGNMSDQQKKNADQVFGKFEGHMGMSKAARHHSK